MAQMREGAFIVNVEFTGGLELLFGNQRKHSISIPKTAVEEHKTDVNIAWLVRHLCENVMQDPRRDMFVLDGSVRPGILVLINDADWALEGEEEYCLQANDHIVFLSTLHGG